MRLAFISTMSGSSWGGSEALWSTAAALALDQGHKVFISVYKWETLHPFLQALKEAGAQIHLRRRYDPSQNLISKVTGYLRRRYWVGSEYNELWDFRPDHVIISQGDSFDILIHHMILGEAMLKRKLAFSLICHNHVQYSHIPSVAVYPNGQSLYASAKKVFVVSNRMGELLQQRLCTHLNNIHFTWNPLNLKDVRQITWPDEEIVQFAMVGALISGKGMDVAMECFAKTEWRDRDWKLNIYGSGYGEPFLKSLAGYHSISDRVHFHGHVSEIDKVWNRNHILLIPSSGEGLPISLIEAMACARPCVATDVGGISEVIVNERSGFIAAAPSARSFSQALERAWKQRTNWESMGLRGQEFVTDNVDFAPAKTLLEIVSKDG